jgi:hypothetical protein
MGDDKTILESMPKKPRKRTPTPNELLVFDRSKRRCALCFHMRGDLSQKKGQIAHLDGDRSNFAEGNLIWLCLDHHDDYDTTTSQSKNFTIAEVKKARADLDQAIADGRHTLAVATVPGSLEADRRTLADIVQLLGSETIPFLRRASFDNYAFPLLKTDPVTTMARNREGPEYEFFENGLEDLRQVLIDKAENLHNLLRQYTGAVPDHVGSARIPIEWLYYRRPDYDMAVRRLREGSSQVCVAYESLVRAARQQLRV